MDSMQKIVFLEIEEWEEEFIKKAFPSSNLVFKKERIDEINIAEIADCDVLSSFPFSSLNKEILAQFAKLKLIATRSTGYDHIDLKYCQEKGIIVCNVPSYGSSSVAEQTFGLILALSRKLIPAIEQTRKGDFSLEGLEGFNLSGKTIGIVGFGNIGKSVARIALGFQMKVLCFSHHPVDDPSLQMTFTDLDSLLAQSDIVTLHLPLTPETKHIINMQNIGKMKKSALLINTARGGLIETQALVEALEKGVLKGAGLDVLEDECYLREEKELLASDFLSKCDLKIEAMDHILLNRNDVLITPHNAFNTKESLEEILQITIEDIKDFLAQKPQNVVTSSV